MTYDSAPVAILVPVAYKRKQAGIVKKRECEQCGRKTCSVAEFRSTDGHLRRVRILAFDEVSVNAIAP